MPRLMVWRLAVLIFLSGASALMYQVLWLRTLSLVFGVTVYAASTLLAIFMAGLSIGSAAGGRLADRVRRPLWWFGITELAIAITAIAGPVLLDLLTGAYVRAAADVTSRPALLAVRVVCAVLVLLPPAVLMGMTSPLALRASSADPAGVGRHVAVLYGVNTAGAVAGALLAGFVLIGSIGMTATFRLAAAVNLVVGAGALLLSRRQAAACGRPEAAEPPRRDQTPPLTPSRVAAVALCVSGGTSLALEVVWFRTLVLYYPATTYAFTAMLATVLAGIAAGSLLAGPVLRRRVPSLWAFGVLHVLVGVTTVAGARWLARIYDPAGSAGGLLLGAALTILAPCMALGIAFPAGVRLALGSGADPGRRIGVLYALNLGGAILGSLLAGFVLLPQLGTRRSLAVLAAASLGTGLVAIAADVRRAARIALPLLAVSIAAFAVLVPRTPDPFAAGLLRRHRDAGLIFMRDEGVQTTVSVHMRQLGGRQMYLDGLHQASDGQDVVLLHRRIGHLPVLLHPNPRRALVIGLGGGATAGAVSLHPGLRVDLVELAPGVIRAAEWFRHINEDVLRRPNVTLRVDDGRNFLLLGRDTYDVITADIVQPTHAGAGLLYSREYFELARRALSDDGVMVQWVGLRSELHYKLIARTFQAAFPETTVWVHGALLVGTKRPLQLDPARLASKFEGPTQPALAAAGFPDAAALLGEYTAGPEELRSFLGRGPILTDDRPLLEYYLSLEDERLPVDVDALRARRSGR